jgi:transposase
LAKRHNYTLGYTVTKLHLQRAGLVTPARSRSAHCKKRPRRPLVGTLLHQDASTHAWLAGGLAGDERKYDLVATMDDATSAIYSLFLMDQEGTASSLRGVREVVAQHGLFCALYTDRGSHYFETAEAGGRVSKTVLTQFGRALKQLGIEHIPAYSPQARGRSERLFGTLQDRLVKELALAGITTLEAANRWLREVYIAEHNARFAVAAHRRHSRTTLQAARQSKGPGRGAGGTALDPGAAAQPAVLLACRAEPGDPRVDRAAERAADARLGHHPTRSLRASGSARAATAPAEPYEFAVWKRCRVNLDYHVEIEKHFYSVPFRLLRQEVQARVTVKMVEIFRRSKLVAAHLRSLRPHRPTTVADHMPSSHRRYRDWTHERLLREAAAVGEDTAALVALILRARPHPEQGFRSCIGILGLRKRYGDERLEAACSRALALGTRSYGSVAAILKNRQDSQATAPDQSPALLHENIRGPGYYH